MHLTTSLQPPPPPLTTHLITPIFSPRRPLHTNRASTRSPLTHIPHSYNTSSNTPTTHFLKPTSLRHSYHTCTFSLPGGHCIQIVQAHGAKEPVLSICYNIREGVLTTGGKDCLVKTWDSTLKEVRNTTIIINTITNTPSRCISSDPPFHVPSNPLSRLPSHSPPTH